MENEKIKPFLQEDQLQQKVNQTVSNATNLPANQSVDKLSPSQLFGQEKDDLEQLLNHKEPELVGKIGRYQIIKEIGRGGMGCVYKAHDQTLDKYVALKIMLSGIGKKELKRFLVEAKAMAKFNHSNIIKIYNIGKDNNKPFIVMDFIEGQSLEQYLQNTLLDVRKFSQLMLKIANAIQYSHDKGIIHRDLKPANIMLDKSLEPQVMDFGLAKVVSSQENLSKKGYYWHPTVYVTTTGTRTKNRSFK